MSHPLQFDLECPDLLVVGLQDGGQLAPGALQPVELGVVPLQLSVQQPVFLAKNLVKEW